MHSLPTFRRLRWRQACTVLLLTCAPLSLVQAVQAAFAPPTGQVLLVIDGNIEESNVGDELHLDLETLRALPALSIETQTPGTEKRWVVFEGLSLTSLLQQAGAGSNEFTAVGVDDYSAEFQGIDLDKYPVIIAYLQDGKPMSLRQLGPLRIIFPFSDFPELMTESSKAMAVWQLVRMTVH